MIRIRKLNKNFRSLAALQDIDLDFDPGQVVSLIGPNGSGKTTLIKCILGLVRPDSGDITIGGSSVLQSFAYRAQLGYMPQIGRYPDQMRIGQLFDLLKNVRSAPAGGFDEELIEAYQLRQIFDKPMRTLSGGTRQKVSAAVAFLFDPKILILDEPTAGLDPISSEILKEKISVEKAKNKLILITSHILSDLDELTTHVVYMQDGQIRFNDAISELRTRTGEEKFGRAIAKLMSPLKPMNG